MKRDFIMVITHEKSPRVVEWSGNTWQEAWGAMMYDTNVSADNLFEFISQKKSQGWSCRKQAK